MEKIIPHILYTRNHRESLILAESEQQKYVFWISITDYFATFSAPFWRSTKMRFFFPILMHNNRLEVLYRLILALKEYCVHSERILIPSFFLI